jgi:hypothetical protein
MLPDGRGFCDSSALLSISVPAAIPGSTPEQISPIDAAHRWHPSGLPVRGSAEQAEQAVLGFGVVGERDDAGKGKPGASGVVAGGDHVGELEARGEQLVVGLPGDADRGGDVPGVDYHVDEVRADRQSGWHRAVTELGLTDGRDDAAIVRGALQEGVGLFALSEFAVTGPVMPGLVFGYGAIALPEIGEGLRRLGPVVDRLAGGLV